MTTPAPAARDALFALGQHFDAVVLVGAQAVDLHTGDADLTRRPDH